MNIKNIRNANRQAPNGLNFRTFMEDAEKEKRPTITFAQAEEIALRQRARLQND